MIRSLLLVVALLFAVPALADVDSGPKAGDKVAALKAFGVVGSVEGKEADFATDRKDSPTVYIFVQSEHWDRPVARFMKTLDGQLGDAAEKAAAVAVWLGDKKADEHKDYLPRAQMSLKLEKTDLSVFDGDKGGPDGWGINSDAHLTVVIANKGKVVKSIGFVSVNETDVKGVIEELKKAAK